jgi:hypothetical protein
VESFLKYAKTILCLANSRKTSGRCIAGKELVDDEPAAWVRPVSSRPSEEISEEERRYENGQDPKVLDVIRIPMLSSQPKFYQSENHLIDDGYYWAKVRQGSWADAVGAIDNVKGTLWPNVSSSYNGTNDRVPEATAKTLTGSLFLIKPTSLKIHVNTEGAEFGQPKRKVRASFGHNSANYKLSVTDPNIERQYLQSQNGVYEINKAVLCISLGELWDGYAYKLIAGVILPAAEG